MFSGIAWNSTILQDFFSHKSAHNFDITHQNSKQFWHIISSSAALFGDVLVKLMWTSFAQRPKFNQISTNFVSAHGTEIKISRCVLSIKSEEPYVARAKQPRLADMGAPGHNSKYFATFPGNQGTSHITTRHSFSSPDSSEPVLQYFFYTYNYTTKIGTKSQTNQKPKPSQKKKQNQTK